MSFDSFDEKNSTKFAKPHQNKFYNSKIRDKKT